ncbi:hypothetical protein AAC387_Pa11g0966 [Persea americana]
MAIPAETQFHVLAVDDSLIDRKLIERLLKTSSYQLQQWIQGVRLWNSWAYMMNREPRLLDLQKVSDEECISKCNVLYWEKRTGDAIQIEQNCWAMPAQM